MTKRLPLVTKCPSFYWYWPNTCVRLSNVLDDSGMMVQRTCDFSIICFLARPQIMERGFLFFSAVGKLIWNRQIAWNAIPLSAFRIPKKRLWSQNCLFALKSGVQDGHWTRLIPLYFWKVAHFCEISYSCENQRQNPFPSTYCWPLKTKALWPIWLLII